MKEFLLKYGMLKQKQRERTPHFHFSNGCFMVQDVGPLSIRHQVLGFVVQFIAIKMSYHGAGGDRIGTIGFQCNQAVLVNVALAMKRQVALCKFLIFWREQTNMQHAIAISYLVAFGWQWMRLPALYTGIAQRRVDLAIPQRVNTYPPLFATIRTFAQNAQHMLSASATFLKQLLPIEVQNCVFGRGLIRQQGLGFIAVHGASPYMIKSLYHSKVGALC